MTTNSKYQVKYWTSESVIQTVSKVKNPFSAIIESFLDLFRNRLGFVLGFYKYFIAYFKLEWCIRELKNRDLGLNFRYFLLNPSECTMTRLHEKCGEEWSKLFPTCQTLIANHHRIMREIRDNGGAATKIHNGFLEINLKQRKIQRKHTLCSKTTFFALRNNVNFLNT